jgi:hypothetical protein
MAKSSQSLGMGLNAFKAGDPAAAYDNFLDSYQVLKANGVPIDPNNPLHHTLLACLAASCIANQDYPHAARYLGEASGAKIHDASISLNQDIVDYVQHVNALRAVKNLTPQLAVLDDEDIPQHEFEVNILGATVEYLARDDAMFKNDLFKRGAELYVHLQNALEKAHPGKIEWAGRWLPYEEGRALRVRYAAEYARYKKSISDRDEAYQRLQDAQADVARAQSNSLAGNANNFQFTSAEAELTQATNNYNAIKEEPPRLKKEIDWPQWPPFPPAKPDMTAAMAALSDPNLRFAVTRSAVAVPVAPDLVLTSAVAVADAVEIRATDAAGVPRNGKVLRKDGLLGLALVKMDGPPLNYLNLAARVDGNKFLCFALPEVTVDKPIPEALPSMAPPPRKATWSVSVARHPRLPGAAVVDMSGLLVGIALGERASESAQVPAVPLDEVRTFLGSDAPIAPGTKPDVDDILELRASH